MTKEQAEAYLHDLRSKQELAENAFLVLMLKSSLPDSLFQDIIEAHFKAGELAFLETQATLYLELLRSSHEDFSQYLERAVHKSI